MLIKYKIPKTVLWVVNLFVMFLLIFTIFRFATYFAFRPEDLTFSDLLPSFLLGMRYDLRWIAVILLPIVVISHVPRFSPFYSMANKKIWTWYLAIVTFVVFFFFAADFGNFSYNQTRLDAGALNFVEDASISMAMLWQSYPMFWLLLGLFVVVLLFRWVFRQLHSQVHTKTDGRGIPYQRKWFVLATCLLCVCVYGNVSHEPLNWKKAFVLKDSFKSYLALNPLQNFFATLRLRKPQFNEENARAAFPHVAGWMGLKDQHEFSFRREHIPASAVSTQPNVVLVLCESFSMYKSSMSGNKLNTTPYFKKLTEEGVFFERCFTPHFSTARGLFATITGIPDVQSYKFSTQNEMALNQRTIINDFEGYEKFYFLGGSPEFNNFKGLLGNIPDLKMYTEGQFRSPKINVWGISDKNLFLEANDVFRQQSKPFFAIVQTADNHRPFMIPEEDNGDFEKITVSQDTLLKYGFTSIDEFNSFRYSDYCFRKFMEAAQKESYFNNTIFVFVGDHGVAGNARAVYPNVWTSQRLTDEHVPLLFYAPSILQPQLRKEVVSQIDVLPTIASVTGQRYINNTLGRNVLDVAPKNNYAFIIYPGEKIGMVTDDYYFTKSINFNDEKLHPLSPDKKYSKAEEDSIKSKLSVVTTSYYETARWMLMNNRKE